MWDVLPWTMIFLAHNFPSSAFISAGHSHTRNRGVPRTGGCLATSAIDILSPIWFLSPPLGRGEELSGCPGSRFWLCLLFAVLLRRSLNWVDKIDLSSCKDWAKWSYIWAPGWGLTCEQVLSTSWLLLFIITIGMSVGAMCMLYVVVQKELWPCIHY